MPANESNPPVDSGAEVSLQPIFARLWARKVPFIATVAAVSGLLGAYFYTRPNIWQADSRLLLAQNQMVAANPLQAMGGPSPSGVIRGVLTSRTVMDAILAKTGYKGRLSEVYSVKEDVPTGIVMLSAVDKDPKMSTSILEAALAELQKVDQTIGISVASRRANQLAAAIEQKDRELRFAENKLANFVASMKAPPADASDTGGTSYIARQRDLEQKLGESNRKISQYRATAQQTGNLAGSVPTQIPSVTALRQKYIDAQNRLDVVKITYGPEAPQRIQAERELSVYSRQLQDEVAKYVQTLNNNIDPNLATLEAERVVLQYNLEEVRRKVAAAPGEQTRLARLRREVTTLTGALTNMRTQYELARQEAEVQAIKYSPLDPPQILPKPINKTIPQVVILPGFLGLLTGLVAFGRASKPRTGV